MDTRECLCVVVEFETCFVTPDQTLTTNFHVFLVKLSTVLSCPAMPVLTATCAWLTSARQTKRCRVHVDISLPHQTAMSLTSASCVHDLCILPPLKLVLVIKPRHNHIPIKHPPLEGIHSLLPVSTTTHQQKKKRKTHPQSTNPLHKLDKHPPAPGINNNPLDPSIPLPALLTNLLPQPGLHLPFDIRHPLEHILQ